MFRGTTLATALTFVVALTLTACGDDAADDDETTPSGSGSDASAAAFPVTVPHKFGETVVEEAPERVVSVGLTEHDVLLQLGIVPVAVTEWYGEQPQATWPWARELLGDAEPEVLSDDDGFEFEKIAALEPDLIIGTNAGMTAKDYELLSAIAPTVTSVEGSTEYFSPWQDQVLQIARGVGLEAEGQKLIDDVEASYAGVAAAHPEWAEMSATFSQGAPFDGLLYVYPAGLNTDFLTELGFTMTPGLEEYAPEAGTQAEISGENVNLIEADVVVFATESQEQFDQLHEFGTIETLPAVTEGRAVYTDDILAGAIYFLTPLSLEYALDELTPMLEQAAAGEAPLDYQF